MKGLPEFTNTDYSYHSGLVLWSTSFTYTVLAKHQGRERALVERHGNRTPKAALRKMTQGTCSELEITFSWSHWTEEQNSIIRAHIASQSPQREGKVVLHISIKQLVLTEQTIIQHSAQKSN